MVVEMNVWLREQYNLGRARVPTNEAFWRRQWEKYGNRYYIPVGDQ